MAVFFLSEQIFQTCSKCPAGTAAVASSNIDGHIETIHRCFNTQTVF